MTREEFIKHLREALNHLQDPNFLRQSPLAAILDVADRFDTFSSLQRILTEAVESLEPSADEPSQSRVWRIYESLFYRYMQQLSQQEVGEQLGLGPRQVRRDQHAALEALSDLLWKQFDLGAKLDEDTDAKVISVPAGISSATVNEELAWLRDAPPSSPIDLSQMLSLLVDLTGALAERHQVRLQIRTPDDLPHLAVHEVALNQALLNVLGVAFHRAKGGQVTVSARFLRWEVEIRVQGAGSLLASPEASGRDTSSLDLARQLVQLSGGRLNVPDTPGTFCVTIALPALEQLPVLAIDDNADTLRLLQRYTANTRYRLIGTRDPEEALSLAQRLGPKIIVLDVMMPQVDGWKVLRRLQQHPRTSHIPVVVCTIVGQEELAFSLGANAFIQKPITQQDLLTVLDQQTGRLLLQPAGSTMTG